VLPTGGAVDEEVGDPALGDAEAEPAARSGNAEHFILDDGCFSDALLRVRGKK
jgi:hypothetical protein